MVHRPVRLLLGLRLLLLGLLVLLQNPTPYITLKYSIRYPEELHFLDVDISLSWCT